MYPKLHGNHHRRHIESGKSTAGDFSKAQLALLVVAFTCATIPPAVWLAYSRNGKGKHPQGHLANFYRVHVLLPTSLTKALRRIGELYGMPSKRISAASRRTDDRRTPVA